MSYENSLEDILHKKNSELYGRLLKIKENAKSLMSYTQAKFPTFTPHDFSHGVNVEENLNWLLTEKVKEEMNPHEIFFLLVSAFMHDWGMIGKPEENPEEIRLTHHKRTEKNFDEMHDKLFLTEHEARIIGRISRGHTKEDLSTPDYDDEVFGANTRIRKRFLSAVLRIADECDVTCNRTPEILYYSVNPTAKSDEEFKKHLSISGVGQLNEKHKIYISAIARDPKGAKTLRLVTEKIQGEIDGVKCILANNGIVLDSVELRMETRGFIDKPIGFEINKKKIVELLIGEHLYGNHDVAIRELVQNGIDACKAKKLLYGKKDCKVTITRINDDTLNISDDGIGMDYTTAKDFLSVIGASYYSSSEFSKILAEKTFKPIAMFGIGLLSSFLIADGLTIETKKDDFESCKFTIGPLEEDWKYQKGDLSQSGTSITLHLNESGKTIKLEESIRKYFATPEVDLFFQEKNGNLTKFEKVWSAKELLHRFSKEERVINTKELLKIDTEKFQVILAGAHVNNMRDGLYLFNRGIFICSTHIAGFDQTFHVVFVDIKEDLIDIHLSREKPIYNKKYDKFIEQVFDEIFETIHKSITDPKQYIQLMGSLIEERTILRTADINPLENTPFLEGFFNKALFPVVNRGKQVMYKLFSELPLGTEVIIYNAHSKHPLDEISLLADLLKEGQVAITNPYLFPKIFDSEKINNENKALERELFNSLLNLKDIKKSDLISILLENSVPLPLNFGDIIPSNIEMVKFPDKWKPIVVIKKPAVVKDCARLGWGYWGNIILWKDLFLDSTETSKILTQMGYEGQNIDSIRIQSKHIACLDANDEFIKEILSKRAEKAFDNSVVNMVQRYFQYLSFLPLVIHNLSSTVIFLEVLENLEKEISVNLNFNRKKVLVERFEPTFLMYSEYYEHCNMEQLYLEVAT